jgi:hypothetical protein
MVWWLETRTIVSSYPDIYLSWLGYFGEHWLTTELHRFLRSYSLSAGNNSFPFMEPKDPSPCSQEPTTGPYPETAESSPHALTTLL